MKKEIKKVKIVFEELDNKEVTIKTYITSEDMVTIIDQMLNQPNLILRESMKNVLILRLCTDLKEFDNDVIDTDLVDYYDSIGVINKVKNFITNINSIDKFMSEYESSNRTLLRLEEDIDATLTNLINKIEEVNIESILTTTISQLQEVANQEVKK